MSRSHIRMSKDDRRALILAAAVEIIGDKGFHGFSIKDLAVRCEMTDAGLLHHFGSKAALLTAVLDERDRQDEIAIAAALGEAADPARRTPLAVRHILRALVQRNREKPEFVRLYAMLRVEAMAPDHPAHAYFRQRDTAAHQMFTRLLGVIDTDADSLARQVLAALDGLELQWLRDQQAFDLVGEWDKLADKLLRPTP
ncbi:TetR/AcrR family transcriptional regulator [Caulobacter soli]|uniref:TetR/AcrR family transcriptional regulator n=1 Tax=Caulobacter soli TaxID=2708539 RepID=UPI0013EA03DE|nr:TetR/AcrR family transcriptional regulator [Caulobacter soli]